MRTKLALLMPLVATACTSSDCHPLYTPSQVEPVSHYYSFGQYLAQTKQDLLEHRYFLTEDKAAELNANMPSELRPADQNRPSKGVLLIHGLGDSPYSFVDISRSLQQQGLLVRTILLPGHGTRPADMLDVDSEQWNLLVEKQVAMLKQEVDQVYIGGFSTGGNLAYSYAAKDKTIKGLMLFSPGFVSNRPLTFASSWLSWLDPWVVELSPRNITNYTRYFVVPTNGLAQYHNTTEQVAEQLEERNYDRPVFMVLSQHDSVLDAREIKKLFDTQFTHPNNRLIWFGSHHSTIEGKTRYINSYDKSLRISNMSHMGVLYSPDNPYYGIDGSERICRNGVNMTDSEIRRCKSGEKVWYSAWDGQPNRKIHARLTFNPWYDVMIEDLSATFNLNH